MALLGCLAASAQTKKYTNHNELSVITYGPAFLESGFGLHTFHGLQVHEKYAVGLNTGLDRYPVNNEGSKWFVPLSAKINYVEFPARKRSFFAALDLGYSFAFLNKDGSEENLAYEYRGGLLLNPQLGWRFKFRDSQKYWSLGAGYRYQGYTSRDTHDEVSRNENKYHLHRVTLQIGLGF